MPTVSEMVGTGGQRAPDGAALRQISNNQRITLVTYTQRILPIDGYVFWLRGGELEAEGSLHYAIDRRQSEDETISVNRVTFTTQEEIVAFNSIGPTTIIMAEVQVGPTAAEVPIRVAFLRQDNFYKSAGLFHYSGESLYPALATQLIESGDQLSDATRIVNNSLPAWLALIGYDPIWLRTGNPCIPLYPSFLVPANAVPPYGSVHIEPAETMALQAYAGPVPTSADTVIGALTYTLAQLMRDRVRITLYGAQNDDAMNFVALVEQYSLDTAVIGLMNMPSIRDDKRHQAELMILAQRKTIDFEISYYQARIASVADQLILSAKLTLTASL